MFDFDHQSPEELQVSLESLTQQVDQLCGSSRGLQRDVCEKLLQYCAYEISSAEEVDPFDDPFVGAAVVTGSGRVLSAHRKTSQNEPHAEAITLANVLKTVAPADGENLRKRIEDCYRSKSWLHSERERKSFVSLFARAGKMVRDAMPGENLILLSTLEPCRDFETQPGCAHLISAFSPDEVWYACDDTNSKGQGRPVLEAASIPVRPNLCPEVNLRINRLFYATVHYLNLLQEHAAETDGRGVTYVVAPLTPDLLTFEQGADRRLQLRLRKPHATAYQAPIDLNAPPLQLRRSEFSGIAVDATRVLFTDVFHEDFIAHYYRAHASITDTIPGIIVSSKDPIQHSTSRECPASLVLESLGVRVYRNVLRKTAEERIALREISQWGSYQRSPQFYALAKLDGGYEARSGSESDIEEFVGTLTACRRLSLFAVPGRQIALADLLNRLRRGGEFDSGRLRDTGVVVTLVCSEEREADVAHGALRLTLSEQGLSARVLTRWQQPQRKDRSAEQLRHEVITGRIDPVYIGPSALSELLQARDWKGRQAAGALLDAACRRDPLFYERLVLRPLPESFDELQWTRDCSLLNGVAQLGARSTSEAEAITARLASFGEALGQTAATRPGAPGLLDVVWRFLAASHSVATSPESLHELLREPDLRAYIGGSPFLLKELFFYSARANPASNAVTNAFQTLTEAIQGLSDEARESVLLRVARLAVCWEDPFREVTPKLLKLRASWPDADEACLREEARLRAVRAGGLARAYSDVGEDPRTFSSYLFLRTAGLGERGLYSRFKEEITETVRSKLLTGEKIASWRGDKTALARLALSEVDSGAIQTILQAMAVDEDDTIQWAALVLALDPEYRSTTSSDPGDAIPNLTRAQVSSIVNKVLRPPLHYWLHREFLDLYSKEHAEDANPIPVRARLRMHDIARSEELIFRTDDGLHPEVHQAVKRARDRFRKVALVLPPLHYSGDSTAEQAATSSTPPLGLGSLAAILSANGHLVKLFDAHRYPSHLTDLLASARYWDTVGFSVVTSTVAATKQIAAELRNAGCKRIVLGGHAPTLHAEVIRDDASFWWDYLVRGDGELTLPQLVVAEDGDPQIPGVTARGSAIAEPTYLDGQTWDSLPWIDRRLFTMPSGEPYEPGPTRSGRLCEAHMVMSRGCDWKCSFCTEALIRGPDGEARRAPYSVVDEVSWLVGSGVDRIQFIDDNLLPQVASTPDEQLREGGLRWSLEFLNGLAGVREAKPFGWRGIFRLEDYLVYESCFGDEWAHLLRESGCSMLAFGIESGDEVQRQALKGGLVTNEAIQRTIGSLRESGVATKGFFMIGSADETPQTTDRTIQFAIESGLDLAYFALYKDFRGLVSLSRRSAKTQRNTSHSERAQFLRYKSLSSDLTDLVNGCDTPEDAAQLFGVPYKAERLSEARRVLGELTALGFSFTDLFKYNDYHASLEEGELRVWRPEGGIEAFLRPIRRAYVEFYLRPEFVHSYRQLLESGY